MHGPLADLARPSAGRRLLKGLKTALSFKASYDASGTWNFDVDLADVSGIIDEAQDLSQEELTAVCSIGHRSGQDAWPAIFALAGLPSLPRVLAEVRWRSLRRGVRERRLSSPSARLRGSRGRWRKRPSG